MCCHGRLERLGRLLAFGTSVDTRIIKGKSSTVLKPAIAIMEIVGSLFYILLTGLGHRLRILSMVTELSRQKEVNNCLLVFFFWLN
jgi:Ca2+/Na+ antiporter